MAFDKTGTLTEEGLDVVGICPVDATDKTYGDSAIGHLGAGTILS